MLLSLQLFTKRQSYGELLPERISSENKYRDLPALADIKKTWRKRVPQRDELEQPFGLQNIRLAAIPI